MKRSTTVFVMAALGVVATASMTAPADGRERTPQETVEDPLVELGRRLFFDPAAARFGKVSCAGCHDPEHGFSDPNPRSFDDDGRRTPRHSQTLLDLADTVSAGFHWDGEFPEVRDVVSARVGDPKMARFATAERGLERFEAAQAAGEELDVMDLLASGAMAAFGDGGMRYRGGAMTLSDDGEPPPLSGVRSIPARLRDGGLYDTAFQAAFDSSKITSERVVDALDAFVSSIRSTESPFDLYLDGDQAAISESAERGFGLFAGDAGCATCHTIPGAGDGRALADGKFHNTGVASRPRDDIRVEHSGEFEDTMASAGFSRTDTGRRAIDLRAAHNGQFKTANLRDVATRPPYMHDGSFESLRDVVDYYADGGTDNTHLDPHIRHLELDEQQRTDLVAFLESLTGYRRPALGRVSEQRRERIKVQLRVVNGDPLTETAIIVIPCGDRLRGTDLLPAPFELTTDHAGVVEIPLPASTHIRLAATGLDLGDGRMIPDTVHELELLAVPTDRHAVVVRFGPVDPRPPTELTFRGIEHVTEFEGEGRRRSLVEKTIDTDDPTIRMKLVRELRDGRFLYASDEAPAVQATLFRVRAPHASGRPVERLLSLSGGESEPLDLGEPTHDESLDERSTALMERVMQHMDSSRGRRKR